MNRPLITLMSALTLGAALPSFAGPDWQAIEQARKAKQATQMARHGDAYEVMAPTGAGPVKCLPEAPVLQLDHGPRAQTTPYQNRLRQERYQAQMKACANPTK